MDDTSWYNSDKGFKSIRNAQLSEEKSLLKI